MARELKERRKLIMNKLISKVVGAALGVALATGVGTAVFASNNNVKRADAAGDATTYTLINSTDDLEVGKSYIFTNGTTGSVKAMGVASNTNNRKTASVTVSNGTITRGSSVLSVTLGGSEGAWTFATENYAGTAGYFASAASGSNNNLKVQSSAGTATISFSGDEAVVNIGPHTSRTLIRYNSSDLFACYASGQNPVYLWKEAGAATSFSVTYDANGGEGTVPTDNTSYNSGATVTVQSGSGLSREDYTFAGWNTAANGSGTSYAAGDTFSITESVTLFAQWTYNIHYTEDTDEKTITWNTTLPQQISASEDEVVWDSPRVTLTVEKNTGSTAVNNYLPPAQSTTRLYTGNKLTFAPKGSNKISGISFTASTAGYAEALGNATWTNATVAVNDLIVTVTPADVTQDVVAVLGATTGFHAILVSYGDAATVSSIAVSGAMTNTSYKVGDNWNPAGLVVTATYSDNTTSDVTSRVTWTYDPATASATTITSVVATATLVEGAQTLTADSAAQTVTVSAGTGSTDVITVDKTDATSTTYVLTEGIAGTVAVYSSQNGHATEANGNGLQYRSNNNNSGIVSTTSGGLIKSVTIEYSEGKSGQMDVYGSNTAYTNPTNLYATGTQGTLVGSTTNNTSNTVTFSTDYKYVGVRSSSGARYLASITFVWEPVQANAPTIAIDQTGSENEVGDTGTLTATTTNAGDNAVIWSSSDSSVVSINSETGAWEAKKIGAATITATLGTTGKYATVVLTVTGTVTVAQARALIDELNDAASVYKVTVVGYVTSASGDGTKNKSNSIYLADTKAGEDKLQLYFGYTAVSNWADVSVVDTKISAKGNLVLYGTSTYEMTSPADLQVISSDRAAVQDFVNAYMHMSDYDPSLDNSQGNNSCLGASGYYLAAKGALTGLTEDQISLFQNDAEFALPKARYEAWAHAYGDTTPYATTVGNARALNQINTNSALMVITIISLVSVTVLGAYFYLRKKKEQ